MLPTANEAKRCSELNQRATHRAALEHQLSLLETEVRVAFIRGVYCVRVPFAPFNSMELTRVLRELGYKVDVSNPRGKPATMVVSWGAAKAPEAGGK